jgi:hypothetical protein
MNALLDPFVRLLFRLERQICSFRQWLCKPFGHQWKHCTGSLWNCRRCGRTRYVEGSWK